MNDIYNIKYKKYKKKYLLLKNLKQHGGFLKFIGSGTSGCLICPPIKPYIINPTSKITDFRYPETDLPFDFKEYSTCDYVGKILAIKNQKSSTDFYEQELYQLLKIKELDQNGDYTPKLIYANIHSTNELFSIFDQDHLSFEIKKCVEKKIKSDYYGYIISKHTGVSLESKYNYIEPDTDINKLKIFLNKFSKLLEFIKILYDNNYLHLDIKMNNITVKKEEDNKLYLIDFGRTKKLKTEKDYYEIIAYYLSQPYIMYSFEPKIYIKLLKYYNFEQITKTSFQELIEIINKKKFEKTILPYSFKDNDHLRQILVEVFKNDNNKHMDINNYILERQKEYFIDYLKNCQFKYFKEKFINEYKDEFLEDYKDEFFSNHKEIFLSDNKDIFLSDNKDKFLSKDKEIFWEKNKDKYWNLLKEEIWEIFQEDFTSDSKNKIKKAYHDKFWKIYEDEFYERCAEEYIQEQIEINPLLNYIFNPIIKKFDMYCMGIVLAEVVLLKYKISDFLVLGKFEKLIQSILFNQFDDVSDIITEINKLNDLLI